MAFSKNEWLVIAGIGIILVAIAYFSIPQTTGVVSPPSTGEISPPSTTAVVTSPVQSNAPAASSSSGTSSSSMITPNTTSTTTGKQSTTLGTQSSPYNAANGWQGAGYYTFASLNGTQANGSYIYTGISNIASQAEFNAVIGAY